jgi:hypothetical protein
VGTATIHDPEGKPLGSIKRLVIKKSSGRVDYALLRAREQYSATFPPNR